MSVDDRGRVVRDHSLRMLHPEEQTVRDMLSGWRNQQLSRNLSFQTIEQRERLIERFLVATNEYPWNWTPAHADEFFADRRVLYQNRRSTIRSYQNAISLFCDYVSDPGYGWDRWCLQYFGTHPIQICHEWNTATHVQEAEHGGGKRPFTRKELQVLFDRADDEVDSIARWRRKGWLPAFRDSVILKVAYAYGLRRNEVRHLQTVDFSKNPYAPEFKGFGHLNVRYGKAMRRSGHKQRNVLATLPWSTPILEEWLERGHQRLSGGCIDLFTTERGSLVSPAALSARFRRYRDDLGFGPELDFHSLRRSYVTHLIEDGWDARFVQEQVGHEYASTTSIYTGVSSDYRTKILRATLDGTLSAALVRGNDDKDEDDETHR